MIFCKKLFFFICLSCVLLLNANFVLALEVTYPTINIFGQSFSFNNADAASTNALGKFVCYLFGLGTDIAAFIAVVVIAWGGIYYLVSYGRGKFTDEGKDWIKAGVLGLLIVVCASLIAYTINPNLNNCRVGILSAINLISPSVPTTPPNVPITTYKEIPIGTLTENLLTRTMDCYGFDQSGNPVDGDQESDDGKNAAPTYLDHDRADCLAQLVDGAQKKSQIIATLSDEITKLMNKCNCQTYGKCENSCGGQCDQPDPAGCPYGPDHKCTGKCVGVACQSPPFSTTPPPPDCCPTTSGVIDPTTNKPLIDPTTGKELSVKGQIERGPISVAIDLNAVAGGASTVTPPPTAASRETGGPCKTQTVDYKGLEELRSDYNNNYGSIKNKIEKEVQINEKQTIIIDTGNCVTCDSTTLSPTDYATCQDKLDKCKKNSEWGKLKLIDQLTYLKGKIDSWADDSKIKDDKNALDQAKSALSGCYLAMPYIDLAQTYEITKQQNKIILKDPETFSDPLTHKPIDPSKYCQGFNYDKSSCFKKCNDACPDTSTEAMACYAGCPTCPNNCLSCDPASADYNDCMTQRQVCEKQVTDCQNKQERCIENCYNSRPCPNDSGDNPSKTFGVTKCNPNSTCQSGQICSDNGTGTTTCGGVNNGIPCSPGVDTSCPGGQTCNPNTSTCGSDNSTDTPQDCISSCQNNCSADCAKKYLPCSDEYNFCQNQCENNGQCVLDNASDCLFNTDKFQQCGQAANQGVDQGNINYCISNAYLCKNGSNEYAGYSDCVDSSISGCSENKYSSSFLYDSFINHTPGCEKCPYPYDSPEPGTACYSGTNTKTSCLKLCPETTKCPASSNCPDCSCDQIDQTLKFSVPNISTSDASAGPINAGYEGYSTQTQKVSAYQIVGPQCNGYSYNDDPLTFYCEDVVWNDPGREGLGKTPIGAERICSKGQDVPVGQTVDDAENWADGLIKSADKMDQDIQKVLTQAINIGNAKKQTNGVQDYCKCAAKFDLNSPHPPPEVAGGPICTTGCQYSQTYVPEQTQEIPDTMDDEGNVIPGYTIIIPAHWECACTFTPCSGNPCQQITDYISMLWNDYRQLKLDFIDFYTTMLAEPRSDIMKELTYSRKTTNDCSLIGSTYGLLKERLLSCTRVEDEIISPISTNKMTKEELAALVHIDPGQIDIPDNSTLNGYCYGKKLGKVLISSVPGMGGAAEGRGSLLGPEGTGTQPGLNGLTQPGLNGLTQPVTGVPAGVAGTGVDLNLTDNWFCCQEWDKTPTTNNNHIYNIQK